jgi:hypothetical protein
MFNQRYTKKIGNNPPLLESIHAPPAGMGEPAIFQIHLLTIKSPAMLFLIIIICLLSISTIALLLYSPVTIDDPPAIINELAGPTGPIEIDYEDILIEIDQCTDRKNLKSVQTRIMIFQSCYLEAISLINPILTAFFTKEQAINAGAKTQ